MFGGAAEWFRIGLCCQCLSSRLSRSSCGDQSPVEHGGAEAKSLQKNVELLMIAIEQAM